jgi:hypothetical protein
MAPKAFTRGQTQVLYRHLPQAIFAHDDYGLCKVESVALSEVDVNRDALFDALTDALSRWTNPRFRDKYPDPRDLTKRSRYAVGEPREVRFAPYPLLFRCRTCERVVRYADLAKRRAPLGKCQCGGPLVRLSYVQAHNCGRLEELQFPYKRCPKGHGPEHIAFYDPGRVRQARWYCKLCNSDIQGLRMTPCKCAYNDSLPPGSPTYEKWLKVVPTGDPSLYIAHTLAFANFPEDREGRVKSAKDGLGLMLARTWGLVNEPVAKIVKDRERASTAGGDDELVEALRKLDPNHPLVKKYDEERATPVGQQVLDRVAALLNDDATLLSAPPRRWLVEHTTLLDATDLSDATTVAAMLRRRGDNEGAKEIEEAQQHARSLLGIDAIRVVNDFPLALCAFGYTRTARDPNRTMITPFPPDDSGKIPIFALASETEALWFQLDPVRVVAWLRDNGLAAGPMPSTAADAWAYIYRELPGLRQSAYEPQYNEPASAAVRTLIHTMSHVFLRRIEWSGFAPSSVGEYLISGSLSFILYANRYADTKIGGLTTLFEQRLSTWLWDAVQAGQECIYDPLCVDEGGSCAGCTHREHNCPFFNRELSRSTLYGGHMPQSSELAGMVLAQGFWAQAWKAAPEE